MKMLLVTTAQNYRMTFSICNLSIKGELLKRERNSVKIF